MKIASVIEIQATPAAVYKALTDFTNYPKWHPNTSVASGSLSLGDTIVLRINLNGKKVKQKVTISKINENENLEWCGSLFETGLMRKIFLVKHSFTLKPLANDGVSLINQEDFSWGLTPIAFVLSKMFEKRYALANKALKDYCEAI